MTALKKYARLEAPGLWRETGDAQRRDVVVSFGNASLIIRDGNELPLTHWSLPAIERINPGQRPALFRPGSDSSEELEIEEADLIDAIEKVRKTINKSRPKSGRLRGYIFVATIVAIGALGAFWLPEALKRHAISVVPVTTRSAIGETLLDHAIRLTGGICKGRLGTAALNQLTQRVMGDPAYHTHIVRAGPEGGRILPGKILLLDRSAIEDHDRPDIAAGYILAGFEQAKTHDPMETLLEQGGIAMTLELLTTGTISSDRLKEHAQTLLATGPADIELDALIDSFAAAKISSTPYAYAVDVTGETTFELIEADPFKNDSQSSSVLPDGDWITLQNICNDPEN